jgi:hypothetical protein
MAGTGRKGNRMPISKRKSLRGGANQPASKAKLGSGGRFKALEKKVHGRNPAAIAAAIGRSKYGKKKFQQLAAAGRRRH